MKKLFLIPILFLVGCGDDSKLATKKDVKMYGSCPNGNVVLNTKGIAITSIDTTEDISPNIIFEKLGQDIDVLPDYRGYGSTKTIRVIEFSNIKDLTRIAKLTCGEEAKSATLTDVETSGDKTNYYFTCNSLCN